MEKEIKGFCEKHPYITQLLLSYGIGFIGSIFYILSSTSSRNDGILLGMLVFSFFFSALFVYPLVLTGYQLLLLYRMIKKKEKSKHRIAYDLWTLFLAILYEFFYLVFVKNVEFKADWHVQLVNAQVHTPLYTGSYVSVIFLFVLCVVALCILWAKSANELPPLMTVLCFSSLYLGVIFTLLWTVQVFNYKRVQDLYLLLLPMVVSIVVFKAMIVQIRDFIPDGTRRSKIDRIPLLSYLNSLLMNAKSWPLIGFLLMLPVLGVIVLILLIFGQAPDALIKAFTETSQWNLSQKVSPQNVFYDEHYLCTVAAGGHRKIVKPLRKGIRHGHEVTVNRQLLVANAFEQLLEERIPKIHRVIRRFYDQYGFPLARIIKSKGIADLIWFLMKPLEWVFLITLYLCDSHPEDRIALQYTGKEKADFYR